MQIQGLTDRRLESVCGEAKTIKLGGEVIEK